MSQSVPLKISIPIAQLVDYVRQTHRAAGTLQSLNVAALSGGYVAAGVYRLDLQFDEATYAFVQKHTTLSEVRTMRLLSDIALPEIPHLISDSAEQAPEWFMTPFYAGHTLDMDDDIPASIIRALAAVHAAYHSRAAQIDWLPPVDTSFIQGMIAYVLQTLDQERERVSDAAAAELRSHLAADDLPALQAAFERLPKTLTHGDVHSGNIMQLEDGSHILFDWGNARIAPGMLDLANMVEYGSEGWSAYMNAYAELSGAPLGDNLARLGYAWAATMVQLQYLPFALGYLDSETVLRMVARRRDAIRQVREVVG
jgi:aminoglycoside phosphotransferase (APT) family kinase protein